MESTGPCRGGSHPEYLAGEVRYYDRNCKSRCENDGSCNGYALAHSSSDFDGSCWTYTSLGVYGDGERGITCYSKLSGNICIHEFEPKALISKYDQQIRQ